MDRLSVPYLVLWINLFLLLLQKSLSRRGSTSATKSIPLLSCCARKMNWERAREQAETEGI